MGDSHARRLRDQAGTYFSSRNVQMEFCCKGLTIEYCCVSDKSLLNSSPVNKHDVESGMLHFITIKMVPLKREALMFNRT